MVFLQDSFSTYFQKIKFSSCGCWLIKLEQHLKPQGSYLCCLFSISSAPDTLKCSINISSRNKFVVVQSLSHVLLSASPCSAACQASPVLHYLSEFAQTQTGLNISLFISETNPLRLVVGFFLLFCILSGKIALSLPCSLLGACWVFFL